MKKHADRPCGSELAIKNPPQLNVHSLSDPAHWLYEKYICLFIYDRGGEKGLLDFALRFAKPLIPLFNFLLLSYSSNIKYCQRLAVEAV